MFRVILGAPKVSPADLLRSDCRTVLALRLAEAEAQLCAARDALEHHGEEQTAADPRILRSMENFNRFILALASDTPLPPESLEEDFDELDLPYDEWMRYVEKEAEVDRVGRRLLRRYEREAQGRRDRAFSAWIEHLQEAGIESHRGRRAAIDLQ